MGHLTNPEESERQRIAGNKAAKKRMPTKEQENYWWSGLTRPVDEVLRKSLGPASSSVQGVLDLFTPARSIAEVANKPTAGNMINAATDTALTAAGLKALGAPAAKVAQKVNRTPGGDDMSKYTVAKSIYDRAKKALRGPTGKKIKEDATPRVGIAPAELAKINKNLKNVKNPTRNPRVKEDATPRPVSQKELNKIKIKDSKGDKIKPPKRSPSTLAQTLKNNRGKLGVGTGLAAGALLTSDEKAKKAKKTSGGSSNQNPRTGYRQSQSKSADEELGISPGGKKQPKASKKKSDPTEGGRYKSYSKDNDDFMYMTQKGYDEMMDDSSGEKRGGRPGRGKMKTQGMNKKGKRKAGFSGKGAGAALRGF